MKGHKSWVQRQKQKENRSPKKKKKERSETGCRKTMVKQRGERHGIQRNLWMRTGKKRG